MDCACIDSGVDEFALLLKTRQPIAKKTHKCHECHKQINPSEQYLYEVTVHEGTMEVHKTCLDCLSVRGAFLCNWFYGRIWSAIKDYLVMAGTTDVCFGKKVLELTPEAKEKVLKLMDELREDEN